MLPSGELLVTNVSRTDAQKSYRCRTHHQLTQEAIVSANAGRIQLSGETIAIKCFADYTKHLLLPCLHTLLIYFGILTSLYWLLWD